MPALTPEEQIEKDTKERRDKFDQKKQVPITATRKEWRALVEGLRRESGKNIQLGRLAWMLVASIEYHAFDPEKEGLSK